ncbi:uncharacterized protein LOC126832494, partial [Patella vulgata]|uniref:uncharacterized protein LOC126832494 n=2 Tax=Patella vulgata TaxID=6465 RepID=UPI0021801FC6
GGYTNIEVSILLFLRHTISISERQIRRILKKYGHRRRGGNDEESITAAIREELTGSGRCLGYRALAKRLLSKYGLRVARDKVYTLLKLMDPEGVNLRKKHQLSRRIYVNKGPNYLIHIDGYDKLKAYGFAIHGGICGYSRRILWLRVGRTNNDPEVVAGYFLEYLLGIEGVHRCIRADKGTENKIIENIQKSLRWYHGDDMAGEKSFLYGPSPANQRIERFWRSAKQGGCQFWMDLFKDLEASGEINTENGQNKECFRFCFTNLIQKDLDQIRKDWNQHKMRPTKGAECPAGKPDLLYFTPQLFDTVDYKTEVAVEDLDSFSQFCKFYGPNGCLREFENVCSELLVQAGKEMPNDPEEALELYSWLKMRSD